ncbi:hypothetical protein [Streptomyces olivaceus]|uniref:hypothetical protein n=1 Tax=Streptomyces olivaceus TaxID=47716 RepID=UPI003638B072
MTIGGTGSPANPFTISVATNCEEVRGCLSGGEGIDYDPATGEIAADISTQAGNNITLGPDGGLLVPTAGSTVAVGCGLQGDGSGSAPLELKTAAWPYSCAPSAAGGVVVCDEDGVLRGEPRGRVSFTSYFENRDYPDTAIPVTQNTVLDSFSVNVTNPDPCRSALVITEREVDVYMVLPAGAGGATGHAGDEMYYTRNTGTGTVVGAHAQSTKVLAEGGLLGPGATMPITLEATAGRGSGGAYYYTINYVLRALIISL